jgi:hypothetical protein
LFLSEELRILNNRLDTTESNLRQAQSELEKTESQLIVKDEDTKMTDAVTAISVQALRASNPSISTPTTEGIPPFSVSAQFIV